MDISKQKWPTIINECVKADFTKLPQSYELDFARDALAQHLAAHGAGVMPSGLARTVLGAELQAMMDSAGDARAVHEYCVESIAGRKRIADADLSLLASALEPLRIAFEADALRCMVPTPEGDFVLATQIDACPSEEPEAPLTRYAYEVLAQACAVVGAPLELSNDLDATPNMLSWARRAVPGDASLFCVPLCADGHIVAVLCMRRDRVLPPPTRAEWVRNLYLASDPDMLDLLAQDVDGAGLPCVAKPQCDWDAHIRVLSRERLPWLPPAPRGATANPQDWDIFRLYEFSSWLAQLIQRVGLPEPDKQLHPYALKKRLSKVMADQAAEQFSNTAEQSAISLSMRAQELGWHASVRSMIGELRQQFKRYHTALTLFANYKFQGSFAVMDALSESVEERDHRVFMILAQVAALLGGPRCIVADDHSNPYFDIARAILETEDLLISIPVYAWKDPGETPALHGYFLAVRDASAQPTEAEWLQWQFFCQAMHSPLRSMASDPEEIERHDPVVIQAMNHFTRQG